MNNSNLIAAAFVVAAGLLLSRGLTWANRRMFAQVGINEIDAMDGKAFQSYLEFLFRNLGHRVRHSLRGKDTGGFITIEEGVRTVVQAKRYDITVGLRAISEALAVKDQHRCAQAMVVSNNYFTQQAWEWAMIHGVTIWDRDRLMQATWSVRADGSVDSLPTPDLFVRPHGSSGPTWDTCAVCGCSVSARRRRSSARRFEGEVYCHQHQNLARRAA